MGRNESMVGMAIRLVYSAGPNSSEVERSWNQSVVFLVELSGKARCTSHWKSNQPILYVKV